MINHDLTSVRPGYLASVKALDPSQKKGGMDEMLYGKAGNHASTWFYFFFLIKICFLGYLWALMWLKKNIPSKYFVSIGWDIDDTMVSVWKKLFDRGLQRGRSETPPVLKYVFSHNIYLGAAHGIGGT